MSADCSLQLKTWMPLWWARLLKAPLGEHSAVERSSFSLEKGHDHLVLCDFSVDEASQCWSLASEELHRTFGYLVPVSDIGIQEVSSTAHHVAHTRLFNVLYGGQGQEGIEGKSSLADFKPSIYIWIVVLFQTYKKKKKNEIK